MNSKLYFNRIFISCASCAFYFLFKGFLRVCVCLMHLAVSIRDAASWPNVKFIRQIIRRNTDR